MIYIMGVGEMEQHRAHPVPVSYTHLDVYKRQGGGCDWTEVSLSLAESLRYSLPQAVFWTDGPAWHLIWPSLIEGKSGISYKKVREKILLNRKKLFLPVVIDYSPKHQK